MYIFVGLNMTFRGRDKGKEAGGVRAGDGGRTQVTAVLHVRK